MNGLVVKASPRTGTEGSILVEQTFQRGGATNLHMHDQGDELFYVVSGQGTATLGDKQEVIVLTISKYPPAKPGALIL